MSTNDGSAAILDPQNQSEDKNWLRLQFLLKQSKVYSSILAEKFKAQVEAQKQREKKEQEKRKAEEEAATAKAKATTSASNATASAQESGEDNGSNSKSSIKKRKRSGTIAVADGVPAKKRGVSGPRSKKAEASSIAQYFKPEQVGETAPVKEAVAAAAVNGGPIGQQAQLRPARQPKLVTGGIMKTYQLEGLDWLCSLYENGLNGILADEMGLGKTLQTISFLAFLREKESYGPFLIVAPVSTLTNWVEEIERFTPDMPVVLYHGTPQEREHIRAKRMKKLGPDFPIVCTSYELIMKDKKYLQRYNWSFIIIDEGHRIKNLNCKLIRELKSYTSANRLLLTGTPLQNNLAELWSLLNFLLPDIFDDLDVFQNWFDFSALQEKEGAKQILEKDRKTQIISSLHAILKPFLLRRVKADVETYLPPKREYVLYAPLTQEQKDLYRALLERRGKEYLIQKLMSLKKEKDDEKKLVKGIRRTKLERDGSRTPNGTSRKPSPSSPENNTTSAVTRSNRRRKKTDYRELSDDEWLDRLDTETLHLPLSDSDSEIDPDHALYEKRLSEATREVKAKKLDNLVMQLRLACNSPYLFYWPWSDDEEPDSSLLTSSGKLLLLDTLLPRLFQSKHKVLIFSQFTTQLDILEAYATILRKWPVARIDGSVSLTDRKEQIQRFNEDPDWKLFLLSTRAGGLGINLTAADTVILFDSDWNPQMDLQAMDRAHRIGQTKPVIVYRFATAGTVEETLLERADAKRRLERLVIWKGKFKSLLEQRSGAATSTAGATTTSHATAGGDEHTVPEEKDLEKILMREDFEKVAVVGEGSVLLSEEELQVLLDRSPEAYERAARGEEKAVMAKGRQDGRKVFKVVETKREAKEKGGILVDDEEDEQDKRDPKVEPVEDRKK